jgi:hypothetical protein
MTNALTIIADQRAEMIVRLHFDLAELRAVLQRERSEFRTIVDLLTLEIERLEVAANVTGVKNG